MDCNKNLASLSAKNMYRIPAMTLALLLLAVSTGFAEWPAWIDKDKIRGAFDFGHVDNREHFAKLAANGVNTLVLDFGALDVDVPAEIALMDKQADWCAELGLHLFVNIRLCGDKAELRYLLPGGRCYVDGKGAALTRTPCPIDPVFWEAVVTRRVQLIAQHSLTHQIDGFTLDPEMYGADQAEFPGYCYCEYCFREFLQHRGLKVEVPAPAQRVAWLQQQGLQEPYQAWKEQQAEALARKTEQAVHRLNPNFVLGGLSMDGDAWYYNAWARGFGTAEMPAIAFSGHTYSTGADKYLLRVREHFKEIKANAVLCPGMYQRRFSAADIASQLFYMAQDSVGYWVFTTYGLALPPEEVPTNDYSWFPPHQQYLDAFRLASQELDRQKQEGNKFTPKLKLASRQGTPQATLAKAGLLSPAQVELYPLDPKGQTARPKQEPTRLRYQAVFYVPAASGKKITAALAIGKEGEFEVMPVYGLIAPSGTIVAEGTFSFGAPVSLNVTAQETGLYKLALAGNHTFSVALDMPHAVQSVNDTVSAVSRATVMYFYVPPDCAEFFIKVSTPYTAEQARLKVWDPSGKEAANVETFETTPALATLKPTLEQRGKVWSFQMIPTYSANLTWDSRLPPYLAESPQALLLPKHED